MTADDTRVLAEISERAARDAEVARQLHDEGTPGRAVFLDRAADYWAHLTRVVLGEAPATDGDAFVLAHLRGPHEHARRARGYRKASS